MKETELESFETDNIYLASNITVHTKIPPEYKDHSGLIWLCYPRTTEVLSAVEDFSAEGLVNCYVFSSVLKRLRGEVINRRKRGYSAE